MKLFLLSLFLFLNQHLIFSQDVTQAAKDYFEKGLRKEQHTDREGAIEQYTYAIILDSSYADAYANRGFNKLLLAEPDLADALTDIQRAIHLNPLPRYYCEEGTVHSMLNREEEALSSYSKAIALDTNYAPAYYSRGITLYQNSKRRKEGCVDIQKAIDLGYTLTPKVAVEGCKCYDGVPPEGEEEKEEN